MLKFNEFFMLTFDLIEVNEPIGAIKSHIVLIIGSFAHDKQIKSAKTITNKSHFF